jgi:hypothetical protein
MAACHNTLFQRLTEQARWVLVGSVLFHSQALAQSADDLAKQTANPIASLISVPIQQNFDLGGGIGKNGFFSITNIQPVIPISLNSEWNLISRTILPILHQERLQPTHESGMGDIVQSLFFSPSRVGPSGLIWGIGPVLLLPTATNDRLGAQKWGAGPTGVALIQKDSWTVGILANHIWSFAGVDRRADISTTLLQPFVSYGLGRGASVGASLEATYDWMESTWTIPLNITYNQVFKISSQAMQFSIGPKYYIVRPDGGSRWGVRTSLVFLFPR